MGAVRSKAGGDAPGEEPGAHQPTSAGCCPYYHQAIELVGRRWTGAILQVLLASGPLRFSEIAAAIPELSDRLLSERMKELEARGVVARRVREEGPVHVEYELTPMGRELEPALREMHVWAWRWIAGRDT